MSLKPCTHCGAPAELSAPDPETGEVYVECSNRIDCELWPATSNRPTAEEAITAWNAGETTR